MGGNWEVFLAACGGVITITGAIAAVKKWVSPVLKMHERITTIEENQQRDYERIKKNEETSRLLCSGMLCLLEVAEEQMEANPTNLQRVRNAKQGIQEYLLQGMVKK